MNLKRIEVHGFKSFADKTLIPLKDGFTAIIGPNGCGKSNVAEAIRWTLGEQSAKSLRGKSMQDVIFSGTEKRRSMSYCEVVLVFDNTGHKIFPTLPFDEVTISRKLDRSGLSEYSINNTRCRMKDIINLLHDTGIGKEGYSIIGQGRIDEILSAKPEDRRNIFEEAAGISKFRAQRVEAERKLEKTAVNLTAAQQVIDEIERQLTPLRRQAETAKKYFELKESLKAQEVNLYIYNYENNESIKKNIIDKLEAAKKELAAKEAAFNGCSAEYERILMESGELDRRYETQTGELLALKVDEQKSVGKADVLKEKIAHLQSEYNRLSEELKSVDAQLIVSEELIKATKAKQDEELSQYVSVDKEYESLSKKLDFVSKSLAGQESELETKNSEYIRAMQELSTIKSNYSSYVAEKGINEERAKNLLNLINGKKEKLDDELTALSVHDSKIKAEKAQMRDLINEYNETLASKQESQEAVKGIGEDVVSLNAKLGQAEGQLNLQIRIKEEYAGFYEPVKRLMQDAKSDPVLKSKILGVTAEIISVPKEYESAIDYALGGHIQCVLAESEREVAGLIAYLKQKNYKRVTFRPRTACRVRPISIEMKSALDEQGVYGLASDLVKYAPEYKDFINSFLGGTIIVDNVVTAERLIKKYGRSFKIVTLDGEVYERSGDITGGSRREQNSGLLAQETAIEQAKANLERIKKNIAQMQNERENREREIQIADERIAELNKEISDLRISITLSEEKSKQAFESSESLKMEITAEADEYEQVKEQIKEINEKLSSIDELETVVKSRQNEYDQMLTQTKSNKGEATNEREELNTRVMELKVQRAQHKSAIDGYENDLFRLKREAEVTQEEKLDLIAELKSTENSLEAIRTAPEKESFSAEDIKRIRELESELTGISDKKKAISERLVQLDADKTKLYNEKDDINQKKVRYEGMLERVDDENRYLQEHILEDYDLTYSSALPLKDPDFNIHGAKTVISDLKKDIAKLGEVNPLAIETLAETEERHDECVKQRDDIQAAYDDIFRIIEELTSEMKDKFMNAFTKIQENFTDVFMQLFGGGKGELKLDFTDTDDPLEAGIDVFAQPPGKSLKNITLLSGGERALTAISILFAILKLKPMPFCVLDEIEAALDDSNANLFAEFLKRFSDYTQFIVITHRKPTMRHSDSIFGITMEEQGVTKVVAIEFEEAVKYASDANTGD